MGKFIRNQVLAQLSDEIDAYMGTRCLNYDPDCAVCRAWKAHDELQELLITDDPEIAECRNKDVFADIQKRVEEDYKGHPIYMIFSDLHWMVKSLAKIRDAKV